MKKLFLFLICFSFTCVPNYWLQIQKQKKEFYYKIVKNNLIVDSIFLCAERFQIEPELIIALAYYESKFDAKAIHVNTNGTYDCSVMQLNSNTFRDLSIDAMFDIECNIFNGSKHLKDLLDIFDNNELLALAAYNAGENRVQIEKIPTKTLEYVFRILKYKENLKMDYINFQNKGK